MSDYAIWKMKQAAARFHSWEGTTESPRGTNRIRCSAGNDLWTDTYPPYQGGAYCAAGDVDVYLHVGIDLRKLITNPYYCPNWVALAKSNGWFKTSGARAGDLVMYGTNGYSVHTGLAAPAPGALYYAHEANTSSGNAGSQANGDGVFHRGRGRSWIVGWVDMAKVIDYMIATGLHVPAAAETKAPTPPKKSAAAKELLKVDGELGKKTYYLLERFSKQAGNANGRWTKTDVQHLQRKLGVKVDGTWGKATSRALQKVIKTPVDGVFGKESVKALQRHLNRGVLAGWWSLP